MERRAHAKDRLVSVYPRNVPLIPPRVRAPLWSPPERGSRPSARERQIQVNYQRRARRAAWRCRKEINARRPYPTANPKTNPIRSATPTAICKFDVITPQHPIETLGCRTRRRRACKYGIVFLRPEGHLRNRVQDPQGRCAGDIVRNEAHVMRHILPRLP